jgi:hypothetical protein
VGIPTTQQTGRNHIKNIVEKFDASLLVITLQREPAKETEKDRPEVLEKIAVDILLII